MSIFKELGVFVVIITGVTELGRILYILQIQVSPFSDVRLASIFFLSVSYLFTFAMMLFEAQVLFSMKSNVLIFVSAVLLVSISKKSSPNPRT